jgi:hypothetical protein
VSAALTLVALVLYAREPSVNVKRLFCRELPPSLEGLLNTKSIEYSE